MGREWRAYKQVFYAAYGFGPYECFFCREKTVPFEGGRLGHELHIHHIDGDHGNSHPYNLVPAHNSCHRRWHVLVDGIPNRRPWGEKSRKAASKARWTEDERQRQAELTRERNLGNTYNKGRTLPAEQKAKMSAARKAWWAKRTKDEWDQQVARMRSGRTGQ